MVDSSAHSPANAKDREFQAGLWISLFLHACLVASLLIGARHMADTNKLTPILPTLRVDLVGLPDQLKSEMVAPAPYVPQKEQAAPAPALKAERKPLPIVPKEVMKLPSTKVQPVTKSQPLTKDRSKRMKNALERIKALSKIQEESNDTPSQAVKGNQVSRGSSMSANAQTSTAPNYAEHVRDRLQNFWALPPWLARQNLAAQVELEINSAGMVSRVQFLRSSGNLQFDNEVKKTIQNSQPFHPPEGGNTARMVVGFPL